METGARLIALVALLPAMAAGGTAGAARNVAANPPAVPLCALISAATAEARGPARTVTTTAVLTNDYQHGGIFLMDPDCRGSWANVGQIRISFPAGREFPDLERVVSQEYMGRHVGMRTFCTCIGEFSYARGYPQFNLLRVERLWSAR